MGKPHPVQILEEKQEPSLQEKDYLVSMPGDHSSSRVS